MKTFITIKIALVGLLIIFALTPKNDNIYITNCTIYKDTSTKKIDLLIDSLLIEKKQFDKKINQVIKNK